jgi:hypothetical protein
MGSEYPDVLGDLVESRQRFEVNGVHYVMALDPPTIAPGETTRLRTWLQSCWDVPVQFSVSIHLPTHPTPALSIIQKQTDVPLQAAEVGELAVPIACGAEALPGDYVVSVLVQAKFERRGLYIRSQKTKGQLGETLLSFTTRTGLAPVMGLGFMARTQAEQEFSLHVQGPAQPLPQPDLTPTFLSHWTVDDLPIQGKTRQYVNDQRLYLLPQLTRQALYVAFLEESQARFRDAGLPLHIGEVLFLAKILTYTAEYFLRNPDRQDAVLIPAYVLAYRHDLPMNNPVFLITRADYGRLARLAISLSFGLLRQRLKHDPWTMEEQMAVADLVTDRVERGGLLPAEFLYLPLLLGGLMVAGEVQMPGEKLSQSLGLLAQARQKRTNELAENPEMVALFDQLLALATSAA